MDGWPALAHTPDVCGSNISIFAALLAAGAVLVPHAASAVVGGTTVRANDEARAWTVKVEAQRGPLCSGVAIEPTLVLTAAHCVLGARAYSISVLDGQMRRRTIPVASVRPHESFLPGRTPDTQPGVDLAILRLASPLPDGIRPVRLGGGIGAGDTVTIAGFGLGQEGRSATARTLRQSTLLAAGAYTSGNRVMVAVDATTLGEATGAGACRGDSGGPIMRGAPGSDELVGIVSWSSGPARQRVRQVCGGFTAITPIADHRVWIDSTVAAIKSEPLPTRSEARAGRRANAPQPAPSMPSDLPSRPD